MIEQLLCSSAMLRTCDSAAENPLVAREGALITPPSLPHCMGLGAAREASLDTHGPRPDDAGQDEQAAGQVEGLWTGCFFLPVGHKKNETLALVE